MRLWHQLIICIFIFDVWQNISWKSAKLQSNSITLLFFLWFSLKYTVLYVFYCSFIKTDPDFPLQQNVGKSVRLCVCVCMGWFLGTHTQIISGKWGIVSKWGWPQIANRLLINLGGSIHATGCPLALLESSILSSSVPGRKSYLLCSFFLSFFTLFGLDY